MRARLLCLLAALLLCPLAPPARADDRTPIDSMDAVTFTAPPEKARVEAAPGRVGGALKFSFDDDARSAFVQGRVRGSDAWDRAAGLSFWVKGDGSNHLGGIEMIWNEDYGQRYGYAFPINSTEWRKITVRWRDLIPEKGDTARGIDPKTGNPPSKLGPLTFGKWWYWKDYAAHSYTIDDIRLEPVLPPDAKSYRPTGAPLARVLAKLKAHTPVTVVTMGDSLTDFSHWTNKDTNWPTFLTAQIKAMYASPVTLVNPAMGGTTLRQNLVVLPRWAATTPAPDLVTIFFGFNDYGEGMRGPAFAATVGDAIDRARRATGGRADVLVLTTCPPMTMGNGTALAEMAQGCRQAARTKNAGLCDTYAIFQAVPLADRPALMASDSVHLSRAGQELIAQSVLAAIAKAGR